MAVSIRLQENPVAVWRRKVVQIETNRKILEQVLLINSKHIFSYILY
jgi:hypothetical protein